MFPRSSSPDGASHNSNFRFKATQPNHVHTRLYNTLSFADRNVPSVTITELRSSNFLPSCAQQRECAANVSLEIRLLQ